MKIFCIGKNYADHAKEMNSDVPESPLVFMKPSTALIQGNQVFYIPEFSSDIHYECEFVVKISKTGKAISRKDVKNYIGSVSLGIDFTARDIQQDCKKNGYPWEISKSFDHSAALGELIEIPYEKFSDLEFFLELNGEKVQIGKTASMIYDVETIIHYISQRFTLQTGDLLYTGTPAGVGQVKPGDVLEGSLEGQHLLTVLIK